MTQRGRLPFILSFLAPAVLIYGGVVVYPLIQAFIFSMYRWRGVSAHRKFIGFDNFTRMIGDDSVRKALQNNLTMLFVAGFCTIALAVLVAHALSGKSKHTRTLRAVVLFPQVMSLVVVGILWMFLFNPKMGLVTSGMQAIGLGGLTRTWLGDPSTALGSVGVAFVWYACGFYVMLFAAALRALPAEITEAAELDGAVGWRRFTQVTWPMLWSIKRIAIVHMMITVMNVFTLVYLMTKGGPDRATEVMLTNLYEKAFVHYEYGYATAMSVVNFIVVMILAAGIMFFTRKNPEGARA